MRLRFLPLLLLCAGPAAFADTIYRWVDASGQAHYTDDRQTIPKGVRATITQGGELGLVWTQNPDAKLPPPPTPPPGKTASTPAQQEQAATNNAAPATANPAPAPADKH